MKQGKEIDDNSILRMYCIDTEAFSTQKKQVFKNKRKNASYVSILFLKNFILCFSMDLN